MALDLSNLRQLPGLAHRPNFPHGLQVLLVDTDFKARQEAEEQLKSNGYAVTQCSCSAEAAAYLSNPDNSLDVLLIDVRCLQQKTAETTTVVQAAKTVPLVIMSDSSVPAEVMLGIKLGAVDFLEKPLSPLKLKNLWQHTVRRLIAVQPGGVAGAAMPGAAHKNKAAAAVAAAAVTNAIAGAGTVPAVTLSQQQQQQQHPAMPEDSGGGSHGSGGESGSNASTSERAAVKTEHDGDVEMSSFAAAGALAGSASGAAGGVAHHHVHHDPMQVDVVVDSKAQAPERVPPAKQRPTAQKYKAPRTSTPGGSSAHAASSVKPAIGYPAGQLPPLPNVPGIEWGLPTNPLQISPKPPAALLGSMPWAVNPLMSMNMNMNMGPAALFPAMMLGAGGLAATAAPAATAISGMPQVPSSMTTMPPPAPLQPSASVMPAPSSVTGCDTRRADSAPLPALPAGSTFASLPSSSHISCNDFMAMPPLAQSPALQQQQVLAVPQQACGARLDRSDLFQGMDGDKASMSRPPIGLQLKKSPSLLDFISNTLKHGDASIPAC